MFQSLFRSARLENFEKELLSTNLIGAKTLDELFTAERKITSAKQEKLRKYPIKGNFDYEHFQAIHRELFQDIYVWAGHDRYSLGYRELLKKGNTEFTHGNDLPIEAEKLFRSLHNENYFKDNNKKEFIENLSSFFNQLNILHPFIEGNGRTQRLFVEELAKNSGYKLNLSKVSQDDMIRASIEGVKGNTEGFKSMIEERLSLENSEPIKINSKLESFTENNKNCEIHPLPFSNTPKKP